MANEEKVRFRRLTVLIKNLENDATQGSLFWHACKLPPVCTNSQNRIRLHKIRQKDRNFPIFFGRTTRIGPILAVRVNEGVSSLLYCLQHWPQNENWESCCLQGLRQGSRMQNALENLTCQVGLS